MDSIGPLRVEDLKVGVPLHVVPTTAEGTQDAMDAAQAAAEATGSPVYLLGQAGASPTTVAPHSHHRVKVLSCAWHRVSDLTLLMPPRAVVFIGGRCRRFWPTAEQRLARQFARLGCRVVFVSATTAA
jgi:hypothetical protein